MDEGGERHNVSDTPSSAPRTKVGSAGDGRYDISTVNVGPLWPGFDLILPCGHPAFNEGL